MLSQKQHPLLRHLAVTGGTDMSLSEGPFISDCSRAPGIEMTLT